MPIFYLNPNDCSGTSKNYGPSTSKVSLSAHPSVFIANVYSGLKIRPAQHRPQHFRNVSLVQHHISEIFLKRSFALTEYTIFECLDSRLERSSSMEVSLKCDFSLLYSQECIGLANISSAYWSSIVNFMQNACFNRRLWFRKLCKYKLYNNPFSNVDKQKRDILQIKFNYWAGKCSK